MSTRRSCLPRPSTSTGVTSDLLPEPLRPRQSPRTADHHPHRGIDDNGIEQYVPYSEAAWTTRAANPISENAELCGFAAWTRGQWLNEHHPMLERTAAWIRERCLARGIPIRKLTPAQVGAGMAGVCGHVDWTLGMRDGSHTDPGPGFPWDVVIGLAAGSPVNPSPTPRPTEEDFLATMNDQEKALLLEAASSVLFGIAGVRAAGPLALSVNSVGNDVLALRREVEALANKPDQTVDSAEVAKQVAAAVIAAGLAEPVIDALAERLRKPA